MRFFVLVALAALAHAPAQAFQQPDHSVQQRPAIDPARLALARTTVDFVWPLGTYARMMNGQMQEMMQSIIASSMNMKASDMVGVYGGEAAGQVRDAVGDRTMRDIMAERDPHFEERFRIMNRVMMDEMVPMMTRLEPAVREGLAAAYARRFSETQLTDLNRFFATPSGAAYASESMMLYVDPEVVAAMTAMLPELTKLMPDMMAKVQAATAHLPPPEAEPASPQE
jgi:hypothetical protein